MVIPQAIAANEKTFFPKFTKLVLFYEVCREIYPPFIVIIRINAFRVDDQFQPFCFTFFEVQVSGTCVRSPAAYQMCRMTDYIRSVPGTHQCKRGERAAMVSEDWLATLRIGKLTAAEA